MRANPIPDHRITIEYADGSISNANTSRINRRVRMHLLEPQTGMGWIILEQPVRLTGLLLNVCRQRAE